MEAGMNLAPLDEAIKAAGVPIDGIGRNADGTPRVVFRPEATDMQRQQAQAILDGWDFGVAAEQARDDAKQPERTQLRQAAAQALADNTAYLAIATPTNAQIRDQVAALTRQNSRIIKRLVQLD
jgi:hypothetical protein